MRRALAEAASAAARGDVPVGALVVTGERLISTGSNRKENDPTAHAEILAMRGAAGSLGTWNLSGCTLFVTVEPCPMCAGAIVLARISRLVFGCSDPRAGACGTLYNIVRDTRLNHRCSVCSGVLDEECAAMMTEYFRNRRAARRNNAVHERS
ncbi:MAG: tRNA-specific adenosine deaminase [Synergistetes bacterium HGW-Synergistetes-2]|nr:MAG: tRNA-specific adenosine deaminase [Synergistetes bacterium HGW-Synergistetes-2]